jgi:hypothetical protein
MIIITPTVLQLANRLNLFTHCIAFSVEYGHTVIFPEFHHYSAEFEGVSRDNICSFPSRRSWLPPSMFARGVAERISRRLGVLGRRLRGRTRFPALRFLENNDESNPTDLEFENGGMLRSPRQVIVISGYEFRAFRCRARHRDLIRTVFTPIASHQVAISECIAKARKNCDVLVGVHVRRGDYRTFKGGRYYYDDDTYRRILFHLREQLADLRANFLICSNDTINASMHQNLTVTYGPGHPVQDLYCLAECDYIVGPPSSFSAWAAFYGDKPIRWINFADDLPAIGSFSPGSSFIY